MTVTTRRQLNKTISSSSTKKPTSNSTTTTTTTTTTTVTTTTTCNKTLPNTTNPTKPLRSATSVPRNVLTKIYSEGNLWHNAMNLLFATALKAKFSKVFYPSENNGKIVYLDSVERNTTKALIKAGFEDVNRRVIVEEIPQIADAHSAAGSPCFKGSFCEYSQQKEDSDLLGLFFDGCSTVETSAKQILCFLRESRLIDGTVIAVNFCRAHVSLPKHFRRYGDFKRNLLTIVRKQGLYLKPGHQELHYSGDGEGARGAPMHFWMVQLTATRPSNLHGDPFVQIM